MKIPITEPYFDAKEAKAVAGVLKSGWVVQGPAVAEFERLLGQFTGAPQAIATSSCTTALHLALLALGIGPGDEVIVPAFTFVATANVVEYVGAKPVFADIDLATFNLDPQEVEKKITRRTKAIIPVHLFGLAAPMAEIKRLARQHQLKVIEDAACAIGTKYRGRHVGYLGDMGAFSFHPRKAITTGEGGVILTRQKKLADTVRSLRDHGASVSDRQRHEKQTAVMPAVNLLGYNYRMTDVQGAIGIEQIKKLPNILEAKIARAKIYDQAFRHHPYLQIPLVAPYSNHTYQSYVLLLKNSPRSRADIATKLASAGISTRQGTQNVPGLGFYRRKYGYLDKDFPNASYAEQNTLALPLYPTLKKQDQQEIIRTILKLCPAP